MTKQVNLVINSTGETAKINSKLTRKCLSAKVQSVLWLGFIFVKPSKLRGELVFDSLAGRSFFLFSPQLRRFDENKC
jgi:hypothetical protein